MILLLYQLSYAADAGAAHEGSGPRTLGLRPDEVKERRGLALPCP